VYYDDFVAYPKRLLKYSILLLVAFSNLYMIRSRISHCRDSSASAHVF